MSKFSVIARSRGRCNPNEIAAPLEDSRLAMTRVLGFGNWLLFRIIRAIRIIRNSAGSGASCRGFSLVEVILAGSIFALIAAAFAGAFLYGQESTALAGNRVRAVLLAEEALEAVRNIADEDFANLADGNHGLAVSGSEWALSGEEDQSDIFTRQITISSVDGDRKEITASVSWQQNAQRTGLVSLASRLTNWQAVSAPNTIFHETFPHSDGAWNGSGDTAQDEPGWVVNQGFFDSDDVQVSSDASGSSPSSGNHLTFEDADQGFWIPGLFDAVYVPVNLDGYEDISISYYWQSDDVDADEGMRVDYSTDTTNGIDGAWTQIAEYINPTDNIWTQESFNLPDEDAVSTFVLRFYSQSSSPSEHMYVDDIVINGISNDFIAPAGIFDLAASNPAENSIELSWTAPGDDGTSGTASLYDVRYSTSPITDTNFSSASQATGEPVPSAAGSAETMIVPGLSPNTGYYFAIKTSDEVSNVSIISNTASQTTLPAPVLIFHETFPNSDNAWNGSGDTAQDEPGWLTYQGSSDSNDVQVTSEASEASPSGGNHLTFEDADQGFQNPEQYDIAYVPIDLSGHTNVSISYYWQSDDVDGGEGLRAAYSTDTTNGIDGAWTQIAEYINPTDNIWTQESFNLPDEDAVSTFALRFSSNSSRSNEHMYVDDIMIEGYAP